MVLGWFPAFRFLRLFCLPVLGLAFAPLSSRIEEIAQGAQGRVGFAATLLETGESFDWHGEDHFPMQSVYKFPIGMAVLRQVDQGRLSLDQKIRVEPGDLVGAGQHSPLRDAHPRAGVDVSLRELLRLAVSESDGSASDVLMRVAGGAGQVAGYLRSLGINGIVVANTEREIGAGHSVQYRNWASPRAAVALLRVLHNGRGLSPSSRALLLAWMTETPTGLNRIKGRLPAGTRVAHKTGTSGTTEGMTAATNDVGLITLPDGRHLAVAVFVSDSRGDLAAREGTIARLSRAAWDHWTAGARQ